MERASQRGAEGTLPASAAVRQLLPYIAAAAMLCGSCGEEEAIPGIPIADAGFDRVVATGTELRLDGNSSRDPGGVPLSFAWTLLSKPEGALASLAAVTTAEPRITPDAAGTYLVSLTVDNGERQSRPDIVVVRARGGGGNQAPVAAIRCEGGACSAGHGGGTLRLSGAVSYDPDGDALSYTWSQVTSAADCAGCDELPGCEPLGEAATLTAGSSAEIVTLGTPDAVGDVVVRLQVHDGELSDAACLAVHSTNNPPVALVQAPSTVQEGEWLSLNGGTSGDTDAVDAGRLTYAWSHEPAAVAVEYDPAAADAAFIRARVHGLSAPATVTFTLTVSDPFTSSEPCAQTVCGRPCCGRADVQVADRALAQGQSCTFHSVCAGGHCECAGALCATRICAASACVCRYSVDGVGCDGNINDGTADPEDCATCQDGACI